MNITYEEVSYDVAKDLIDSIIQNLLALAQLAYLALKGFSRQVLAEVSHYVQSLDWMTLFTVINLIHFHPHLSLPNHPSYFVQHHLCHHSTMPPRWSSPIPYFLHS